MVEFKQKLKQRQIQNLTNDVRKSSNKVQKISLGTPGKKKEKKYTLFYSAERSIKALVKTLLKPYCVVMTFQSSLSIETIWYHIIYVLRCVPAFRK